ncbi:33823_t:CDS:2, partial [Gigaspora margarita]
MSNNKRAKYSNFQKTCEKMPKSKINHGPSSAKGNLRFYPYLQPGYQICSPHYIAIVKNQLPEPTSTPTQ